MDIGCYPIHLSRFLFGEEPERVMALVERDPVMGIDRLTSAILDFPSGRATFTCSTQLVPHQRLELFGTTGRIEVEIPFNTPADRPARLVLDDGSDVGGGGRQVLETPAADQYALQAKAFSGAVLRGTELPVPLEDGLLNMRAIEALFRSGESGAWERVG